jgi:hypothetical protein
MFSIGRIKKIIICSMYDININQFFQFFKYKTNILYLVKWTWVLKKVKIQQQKKF